MNTFNNAITVVFNNGQIIIGQENSAVAFGAQGVNDETRSVNIIDPAQKNLGTNYWVKYMMKELGLTVKDISLQCKGKVFIRR